MATHDTGADVARFFSLQLEGKHCCWLHKASGGGIYADVVSEPGKGPHSEKHIGSMKYEEIVLDLSIPVHQKVAAFISATWKMEHSRLDGSVVACNRAYQAIAERRFTLGLLKETTIPALDVDDRGFGFLRVKLSPEAVALQRHPEVQVPAPDPARLRPFGLNNFKLTIDGLHCEYVTRIDSFTVKQALHDNAVGEHAGVHQLEPGSVVFPNLTLTLVEGHSADGWYDWFKSFVIEGKNDEEGVKKGRISLLSPDRRKDLAHIDLFGLGIFRMADVDPGNTESLHRISVELYCERMEFVTA